MRQFTGRTIGYLIPFSFLIYTTLSCNSTSPNSTNINIPPQQELRVSTKDTTHHKSLADKFVDLYTQEMRSNLTAALAAYYAGVLRDSLRNAGTPADTIEARVQREIQQVITATKQVKEIMQSAQQ